MLKHHRFGASLAVAILALAWTSTAMAAPMIFVRGAWMRPAAAGASGAAYLTITNGGPMTDTLIVVASPNGARASIHESRMVGQVMTMRALPNLAIRAGATARFSPAGLHVMIERLKRPLKTGERLTLFLTFASAGRVQVTVRVRADALADPMAGMKM